MKLRVKMLTVMVTVFVVFVIAGLAYGYIRYSEIRVSTLENTVSEMDTTLSEALAAKEDVWITNALMIAQNPIIAEGLAEKDRQSCIELLDHYGDTYREFTSFQNVQI